MDEAERFQTDFRLQLEHYHNLNNPLHLGRFQNIVYEFMERVRADAFDDAPGQELMEEFCDLVDNDHVWHLAETRVPEFRLSWQEQKRDIDLKYGHHSCLAHVLYTLHQRGRLPSPRLDASVLDSEQDLAQQRHKMFVEYIVTGGAGEKKAAPHQLEDIGARCKAVQDTLNGLMMESGKELSGENTETHIQSQEVSSSERQTSPNIIDYCNDESDDEKGSFVVKDDDDGWKEDEEWKNE